MPSKKAKPAVKPAVKSTVKAKAAKAPVKAPAKKAKDAAIKVTTKSKATPIEAKAQAKPLPPAAPMPVKLTPAKLARKLELKNELIARWESMGRKHKNIPPQKYNMKNKYENVGPLEHKDLGLGYILSNKNDRLEVLFQDGIRNLISNYKVSK